jgi:hypothetical protein
MPTWEFICSTGQYDYDELDEYGNSKTLTTESSDDLLAKYDVIIIGAKQDASNGLNGYNKYTRTLDGSTSVDLGNLVYVSVGGTIGTGTQQAYGGNTGDAEVMNIRYSGNDITLKKLLELEDFLRAGKPIVVDSGLYKDGQVDTAKVDKSSKIYDLLTWDGGDSGAQKNIFASNNINSSRMKNLIMNKSCRIEFYQGGYPTEYNYVSENTTEKYNDGKNNLVLNGKIVNEIYQSKSSNGTAVLTYHFYISGNDSDTYNAYLNIDLNGDGVYSSSLKEKSEVDNMNDALGLTGKDKKTYDTTESAMGLTIYDRNMNKLGTTDPDNPKKGYALKANTEYYATRTIPSSQQGMLPWKLEIQSRSNSYNRSSAVDYTAVYNSENKKTISVLQMTLQGDMSKDNSSLVSKNIWGNWNSMTAFTTDSIVVNTTDTYSTFKARMKATDDGQHYLPETESTRLNNLFSLYQKHTAAMFESYLEPVQEFDVTIQYMFNQDWYTLFGTTEKSGSTYKQKVANWEDFLSNYDMVVIGFIDSNSYTSNAVYQEGIKDFVNQGKSMILSHDTVSGSDVTKIGSAKSGYTENAVWLRTISGQRRAYYNKQKDGTYKKSYNDVKVNGVTYSLVTDYIVDYYDDLLGTYNPSDYGESGESYLVNEYPDNGNFIGTYYRIDGREGSTLNIERVAKSGTLGSGWPDNAYTSFIKLTNNGQITTYPYKLGSVIQVLNTHTQNFQLDLDYEEGGDVNVWFNLSDRYDSDVAAYITENNITSMITGANYYSARNQDGRNNFYIYNKGNITYTGSGHGVAYNGGYNGMMTSDEIKLFINTMIASYRQPESEPVVSLDDVDGTDSEGTGLIYLDYDGYTYDEADGTSGSTVKNGADSRVEIVDGKEQVAVYFTVTDIGTATLTNKNCYLSITQPSATDAGKEVAVDPGTVKLIEISTDKDGKEVRETIKTNSDGKYLVDSTNSGVHYVMYFPYSEVRDGTGTVEFNYTTQATYTKKNRDVTTTEKKTSVDIMLLPLFDLD